jgi:hypothetical protein
MKWEKEGLVFSPSGASEWHRTHAHVPLADKTGPDTYRVYFAARNEANHSQIGYLDASIENGRFVIGRVSNTPALSFGAPGTFDDSGVFPSSIVNRGTKKYLYYVGWNQGTTVLYYSWIGLAVSTDGGKSFQRVSEAPVLDRSHEEPIMGLTVFVLREEPLWRMWYTSGVSWVYRDGKPFSSYNIKYAESKDGIAWKRSGKVSIGFVHPHEHAIARPWVLKERGTYRMWYCYKANHREYRIGYAESRNGRDFTRMDDQAGIGVSPSGWDSEMVAYPCVFKHKGVYHMLFNGNRYGREGFGHAVMTEP